MVAECRFNCNGGIIHVSFIVNKVRFITNRQRLIDLIESLSTSLIIEMVTQPNFKFGRTLVL